MKHNQAFKVARNNAGLNQHEAAELLGVSNVTLCRWEGGKTQPIVEQLVRMGEVYRCSIDQLCGVKPF